jgi:uncharacterized protein (TIGR02391 family)
MAMSLKLFEQIVRNAHAAVGERADAAQRHPFDERNLYCGLPAKVRRLFDDGHYAEATFEAFKYVDKVVQGLSSSGDSGQKLMMSVFAVETAKIKLTSLSSQSEIDEQKGYQFLFSGAVMAIRNPRGHEVEISDDLDTCLDHLSFASLLLRRLEAFVDG